MKKRQTIKTVPWVCNVKFENDKFCILMDYIIFDIVDIALNIWIDISIAAVDLMQELTDVDTLNESDEGAGALIGALVCIALE